MQPVFLNSYLVLLWLPLRVSGWALQTSCLGRIPAHLKLFSKLLAVQNARHFSYGNVLCVVLINVSFSIVFLDSFHSCCLWQCFPLVEVRLLLSTQHSSPGNLRLPLVPHDSSLLLTLMFQIPTLSLHISLCEI